MKSKGLAYLFWFLLGALGVHKFYLNKIGMGIFYVIVSLASFFCTIMGIPLGWGIIGLFLLIDLFTLGSQVENYNLNQQMKLTNQNLNTMTQSMTAMTGVIGASTANTASMASAVVASSFVNNPSINNQHPASNAQEKNQNIIDKSQRLRDLKTLLDAGVISQEEFVAEKTKILNS